MSKLIKKLTAKSTNNHRKANRILKVAESLEARQLMAADLAVFDEGFAEENLVAEVAAVAGEDVNQAVESVQQTAAPANLNAAAESMREMAASTGQVALDQIDGFATFAGVTIEAPTFGLDGSVTGTTQFGNASAPVLLQFIPETGDWVLAVESQLGELLPADSPIQSPFEFESPIFVFSPSELRIESESMSEGSREFYGRMYESDDFTVRLERGVNLLSRATLADNSLAVDIMEVLGVDVPSVELEGVILRDFNSETFSEFKEARKDGNFWSRFREDMLLRATLPEITIDGLPDTITTGDAYIGWQSPGTDSDVVFAAMDLMLDDGDGVPTLFTGRLAFADTPTGSELRLSAVASQMNNAFGVTGFDINEVTLLLDIDTVKSPVPSGGANTADPTAAVPTFGLGLSASMDIGDKEVMIAGKVELSMLTGTPLRVAVRGELSSLSTTDLLEFANQISGLDSLTPDSSHLPEIEFRDVMINIAPMGGDEELGIEDGIGLRGELYLNGNLLGRVDGLIDRTGITPKIQLSGWTTEINLGALHVSEVDIDISMTQSIDDYFQVKGAVEFMGVSHAVDIDISATRMYYSIATEVDGLGMVDYAFESSLLGIPHWTFRAVVRNDLSQTLENDVASSVSNWADEAHRDFAAAQSAVDAAQRSLHSIVQERNAAIAEAQREFDQVEADLAAAQRTVDSLASSLASWRRSESRAHSSWQSAVRTRRSTPWYSPSLPGRLATEAARYASYVAIRGSRIAVQGSLNAASAVLNGVRSAAGWALDAAGPEAHPNVIRLTAELAIKTAALEVAEVALHIAEDVSTGAADVVAFVAEHHDDLFMIDEIRFDGTLSAALIDSSFDLEVDFRFMNQADTINIETPTVDLDAIAEDIFNQVRGLIPA